MELRVEIFGLFDEVGEAILGCTEVVVLDVRRRTLKAPTHELRPVNAVGHDGLLCGQADAPSERHAIGNEMIDGFRAAAEFRVGEAQCGWGR